jgi:DEAD/DEAH box helicase domain-containing protein
MSRLVLDIETQFFGNEVPRRENKVAVAGYMDIDRGCVYEFVTEPELPTLFERMDAADLVIGHNLLAFDYAVLSQYHAEDVRKRYERKTLDTLADLKRRHGRRLSLDALADATLAKRKVVVAEGVPMLWRTGRLLDVVERNRSDVELTRDVYLFGRQFGYVGARDPDGAGFVQLEVDWT